MDQNDIVSRRRFLQSTATFTGASLLRIGAPTLTALTQAACSSRDEAAPFVTLSTPEAADFAAIAARIIPTTDTPGATEAGVIYFWDNVLGATQQHLLASVRSFREDINAGLDKPFAELDEGEQDATLRLMEQDMRFEVCRVLTIFGFFAMEKHGGNKGQVSWDLIGFGGHHGAWTPPFGHYDAEYDAEHTDGE